MGVLYACIHVHPPQCTYCKYVHIDNQSALTTCPNRVSSM